MTPAPARQSAAPSRSRPSGATPSTARTRACAPAQPGRATCFALRNTGATAAPNTMSAMVTPGGYGPVDLRAAYKLPSVGGAGATVAIVDAYDDPKAEADLNAYRTQYGLGACTTANGCFKKVNQAGGSSYPRKDGGWAQEISLDLDMVSATCPDCRILLVEATTASFANLGAAVTYAADDAMAAYPVTVARPVSGPITIRRAGSQITRSASAPGRSVPLRG